MSNQSGVLLSN